MLKKVIVDERGRALIFSLFVLGAGMILLPMFLAHINTNLIAARTTEVAISEYYASDAGIEYTLWRIKCDGYADGLDVGDLISDTIVVGKKGVSVSLVPLSSAGGSNEVDAMLVLDRSGSMDDDGVGCTLSDYGNQTECEAHGGVWGPQPITAAKEAAKAFVDIMEQYSGGSVSHQVGLVSYATGASLDQGLTTVYTDVRNAIDSMSASGWTAIGDAIAVAAQELQDNGRENSVKAIVLLSDGVANVCPESYGTCCSDPSEGCFDGGDCEGPCATYAKDQADEACEDTPGGINFFSIALGTDVDADLMKYIARYDESKPEGCEPYNGMPTEDPDFYLESPTTDDLEAKFRAIALYLTSPQYTIRASAGDTTIESSAQHSAEADRVGIFSWLTTE